MVARQNILQKIFLLCFIYKLFITKTEEKRNNTIYETRKSFKNLFYSVEIEGHMILLMKRKQNISYLSLTTKDDFLL